LKMNDSELTATLESLLGGGSRLRKSPASWGCCRDSRESWGRNACSRESWRGAGTGSIGCRRSAGRDKRQVGCQTGSEEEGKESSKKAGWRTCRKEESRAGITEGRSACREKDCHEESGCQKARDKDGSYKENI
jgi:hypothetical protein